MLASTRCSDSVTPELCSGWALLLLRFECSFVRSHLRPLLVDLVATHNSKKGSTKSSPTILPTISSMKFCSRTPVPGESGHPPRMKALAACSAR